MKKQTAKKMLFASAGIVLAGIANRAIGQITVDGTRAGVYGAPLAVQTVNTAFGDSTIGDGTSNGGSELDAAYGNVSNGTLYLFFAGNFESNGNHLNIFLSDGRSGGQNILNANSSSGNLSAANGLTFPSGFNATYAIDVNDYANTLYIDQYDLTKNSANYLGNLALPGGVGNTQNINGLAIALNDTNAAGVNGSGGTAADPVAAAAVNTGFEIGIPLSALGNPNTSIGVIAAVNGGGDTYFSNEFLPGLPVGSGNVGAPASANLGAAGLNSGFFNVAVPATMINGNWLPTTGGSWNTSANWSNGIIPNAAGAAATFATATQDSVVTLDAHITVGSITFNSAYSYTIASGNGGVLTMNGNGSTAIITSYGGSQVISAPVVLASNTSISAISHGDIITVTGNISGPGQLIVFDQGGSAGGQFPISLVTTSGSNSYTGGTNISGGNLQLGSATALPANTALTLGALDLPSGVLDINGFNTSLSSITVLTGSQTAGTGSVARIINGSNSSGMAVLTYAGLAANPTNFNGVISDNSGNAGGITSLAVTSGSLTLAYNNSYGGFTNVSGGATLTLASPGALPGGTNLSIGASSLVTATNLGTEYALTVGSIAGAGKFDLNNNALVVHSSTVGAVTALVASGYNNGKWNGATGIVSTTAASDSTHLTALAVIPNTADGSTILYGYGSQYGDFIGIATLVPTDVLVKYTYYGDTNLDGIVDGTDYSRIDAAFANNKNSSSTALTGWFNGDFNYDGVINGSDYALIDNAFNRQGASLAAAVATAQVGTAAVPEPACLSVIATAAAFLGRRRVRRAG